MARSNLPRDSASKPSLVMSSLRFSLSSKRMTIFSPKRAGMVETRKSRSLILPSLRYLIMMRPSWGKRFSLMSSLAMILTRLIIASRSFVGGVLAREVFHHLGKFFFAFGLAVELGNGFGNRRLGGHHRFDVETGHELNVVHGEDVGRIGHRNGQGRAYPGERNNLIADGGVLRDQLDNGGVDLIILQIDGGNPVLAGKHTRYLVVADEAELHQARPQPGPAGFLVIQGLTELVGGDQVFLDQYFAEPGRHRMRTPRGIHTPGKIKLADRGERLWVHFPRTY